MLAVEGGRPVSSRPLPPWPQFAPETAGRVVSVLDSGRVNYWTGDAGRRFEQAFAAWLGAGVATAVSNGTVALQLALEALGVGSGDEVVCTPYSFRASATCAFNAGATPVFADVGEDHLLNARTISRALTPRTKAVVVVHLYGQVADMGPILALAKRRGLFVVEDCAQCLGGCYRGRKVGTLGDVGCFSFCQSKHFTTGGEGGMVVCRDPRVAARVVSLRDHGWAVGSSPKRFERVGYNARMTEIQSVIGLGELARLDRWNLPRRRRLADALLAGLAGHPLVRRAPVDTPVRRASFWLMPFVLDAAKLTCPVGRFVEALQAEGAGAYRILWPLMAAAPVARSLIGDTVGFWVHPTYTMRQVAVDLKAFRKVADALMAGDGPAPREGRGGRACRVA